MFSDADLQTTLWSGGPTAQSAPTPPTTTNSGKSASGAAVNRLRAGLPKQASQRLS
jgi:hypothetical protein